MQSPAPPEGPPGSFSFLNFLKEPGYYLWLAAIGAIVYAYVFVNREVDDTNKTDATETDPATGTPTTNTGNRVITLLPFVWLYTVLAKLFTRSFTYAPFDPNVLPWSIAKFVGSALLVIGMFLTLAYFGFWTSVHTTSADGFKYDIIYKLNFSFLGIAVLGALSYGGYKYAATRSIGDFRNGAYDFMQACLRFIMNLWFPLMMMYYLVKTGATYWFQVVACASIGIAIAILLYDWFKVKFNMEPLTDFKTTVFDSLKYVFNTFPLSSYLKYVENSDLTDIAKRVLMFALLCYVAYLMISVYKFKNQLVLCVGSSFASCFWNANMPFNGYDPNKQTPYVNALVYAVFMSMGLNLLNWVIKLFSFHTRINNALNGKTDTIPSIESNFNLLTFIQMIIFPFYWILKMFMERPVAIIGAFIAFAALGLLLYRSSFDLTAFIEGQRGTVIALFTMFIASLIMFGVYMAGSKSTGAQQSAQSAQSDQSGQSDQSEGYLQFIMRPLLLIAVAACIMGLLFFFLTSHSRLTTMANLLQYGITALIYIGAIAIVISIGRTVFSTSRKMGDSMFQLSEDSNWVINVLKLIANALFYLPCLLIDGVEMLKEQYNMPMRPWLILLALQAVFILAGHFLPALVTRAINHTGIQILSAPVSMATETQVANHTIQFVNRKGVVEDITSSVPLQPLVTPAPTTQPASVTPVEVQLANYRYGVSAWFYIDPQPPNMNAEYANQSINVFNFGGDLGPSVTYAPSTNALNVSIAGVKMTSETTIPPITDIPLQRWNNLVINSDKGAIDIFMNGRLIYTGTHVPEITKSTQIIQTVVIGQGQEQGKDATGIQGEICNMVLNREPFTKAEIAWFYSTNRTLNPPVVGASNLDAPQPQSDGGLLTFSQGGSVTGGWVGAVFGLLFGWLFNNANTAESAKGALMGAVAFGLIGALLGALFSTDGTVANIMKAVANVFVDMF
jgi:hypothetical protein